MCRRLSSLIKTNFLFLHIKIKTYIPSVINFVTSSKYNLDGIFNNIVTFGCWKNNIKCLFVNVLVIFLYFCIRVSLVVVVVVIVKENVSGEKKEEK